MVTIRDEIPPRFPIQEEDLMRYQAMPALMVVLLSGCVEATSPPTNAIHIQAVEPLRAVGTPETYVTQLPTVKVTDAVTLAPVAGQVFTFLLESPVGSTETINVTTGQDGIARLPGWRLGAAVGLYTASVSTNGWGPAIFSVMVPGKVVAIYDLKTVNGVPMPYSSWWLEDHYVLYESGVFNRFTNAPAGSFVYAEQVMGTYYVDGDRIHFRTECFADPVRRCVPGFRSLLVRGNELVYETTDWYYDMGIEVYERREGAAAAFP